MFDLQLMLILLRQRTHLRCRTRDIIHRINHRFIVIGHGQVTLRFGDVEIRIQPAAVEDRER